MIVFDASVIYKLSDKKEKSRNSARKLLEEHLLEKNKIIILDLTLYELSNAWATKTKLPLPKIKINLWDLQEFNLEIESVTFSLLGKAIEFARKYHVSVYDASYAVLAQEKGCDLYTADNKFVKQINLPFVKLLA